MGVFVGSEVILSRGRTKEPHLELVATSLPSMVNFLKLLRNDKFIHTELVRGQEVTRPLPNIAGQLGHTVELDVVSHYLPVHSWDYTGKTQVVPLLPVRLAKYLPAMDVPTLPTPYVHVARLFLKRDYYLKVLEAEGNAAAIPTLPKVPSMSSEQVREAIQAEYKAEYDRVYQQYLDDKDPPPPFKPLPASVIKKAVTEYMRGHNFRTNEYMERNSLINSWRDPRRPAADTIKSHYLRHLRHVVVKLLAGGWWIDQPSATYPEEGAAWDCITDLNRRMRGLDLGRNAHLQFSSNPGKPHVPGRKPRNRD